jgi:hypothetical protein
MTSPLNFPKHARGLEARVEHAERQRPAGRRLGREGCHPSDNIL